MRNNFAYKGIIWDFNGTLLNDVTICLDSINTLLARRSYPLLSEEKYKATFGFPVKAYYEKIGFDFKQEPWKHVADEYMHEYWKREHHATLFSAIPQLLQHLSFNGLSQFVLSAMEQSNLTRFLNNLDASKYFDQISGINNDFADGKIDIGIQMMATTAYQPSELLLVGDTIHDYEVAKAMGVDCILFAGGHQSAKRLQCLPCPVIKQHNELYKYIVAKN